MTVLSLVFAAAGAAVTFLHLRSRPRRRARPFPSFQHVVGLAPRRRPAWPLEEPLRWLLRVLALLLAAAGLFLSRGGAKRALVVLVEADSPAWNAVEDLVRTSSGAAIGMTFRNGRPVVDATPRALESGERARRALGSCSADFQNCLVRAARAIEGDVVVVSSFRERADELLRLGPFRYVRVEAPAIAVNTAARELPKTGSTRVRLRGTSPGARVWAAALETVQGELGAGDGEIDVVDTLDDADPARATLVPVVRVGVLARAATVGSVRLDEDAALATGAGALALDSSLSLRPDVSIRLLVDPVLAARGRIILAAASEEDLGNWAHASVLTKLARVVLFEAGRHVLAQEPAAGSQAWTSLGSSAPAPVGILDVAPGAYGRADGRVDLVLSRPEPLAAAPDDAALAGAGGRRMESLVHPAPEVRTTWVVILFSAALVLRVLDVPRKWSAAWIPFALVALLLALETGDASFRREVAATAEAPLTTVLAAGTPLVTIAAWDLPSEIRVGEAALLTATLVVERAAGRELTLRARPTSGPSAEIKRGIAGASETLTLTLPVSAVSEGISFALVSAMVTGRGGGDASGDAVVVPLVTRARPARRLLLAAAPTWEARAAGEALASLGPVERVTRVGAKSSLGRGGPALDPLRILAGDLGQFDLVVLIGFSGDELSSREAPLATFVRAGGGLLFVGGVPRLRSLPVPRVEESGESGSLPSRITGTFGEKTISFSGFDAWKTTLPAATAVLARLDGAPWIVGRAFGRGRIAAFTAPDAWRAATGEARGSGAVLFRGVVAWLEAARTDPAISLSRDLRSLERADSRTALPASLVGDLPVDPVDPFSLLPPGRGRVRVLALREGRPLVEVGSVAKLDALRARIPPPAPLSRRVYARDLDSLWILLCALLAGEVALRRRVA